MKLSTAAAIATIIGTVIVVLQYIDSPSTSRNANKTRIEKVFEREKANIKLSLDLKVYKEERNWLLAMYEAAISMPYASTKSDALKKVVKASLEQKDYNMAIIAAKESPYASTKAEMLNDIVEHSIASKSTIGYALVAADAMPYSSSKSVALEKIISSYETFAKQQVKKDTNE